MAAFTNFRTARWVRTANLLLQSVLLITLFGGLNYIANDYYGRIDLTRLRKHSLSPETKSYLEHLTQDVDIIVTAPDDPLDPDAVQAQRDVEELLQEYAYVTEHSSGAKIKVVSDMDIFQSSREAKALGIEHPNAVYFISEGKKTQEVYTNQLYQLEHKERVAFLGEKIITEKILDMANVAKPKIYFLTGHGEMDVNGIDPRGLSLLKDALRERNFELTYLDLSNTRKIPDDATAVLSLGAVNAYEDYEQEALRQFLSRRAGRLMILLSPKVNPTGLEALFYEWGIAVDDDLIHDNSSSGKSDNNELVLREFSNHPITKSLGQSKLLVFGATRSVRKNPSSVDVGLIVTPLVLTTAYAVAEYNPSLDGAHKVSSTSSTYSVVTASERVQAKDNLPFNVKGGRLVVFGCSDFVANARYSTRSNWEIFRNALNWLSDRDTQLNVPARKIEKFQLTLSSKETVQLRYALLGILPGIAFLLGVTVYLTRRS